MLAEWMKNPAFKAEYDNAEKEFALLDEMLAARKNTESPHEQVAWIDADDAPELSDTFFKNASRHDVKI